jgi:mannose-6-phosphate isomerase-like protein (cupin superfamily)
MTAAAGELQVLDAESGPELPIVEGAGSARAIVWPGTGARLRSMHRIRLEAGAGTVPLTHPSDAVYYVIAGAGSVEEPGGDGRPLELGSMAHVDAGTTYRFRAGDAGLDLIGGPAPADPALYAHLEESA